MKLIDQIEANWPAAKKLRLALVMEDMWGETSRLDQLDGLRTND